MRCGNCGASFNGSECPECGWKLRLVESREGDGLIGTSEFREMIIGLADTFGLKTGGDIFDRRVERYYRRFARYDARTVQAGFDAAENSEDRFPPLNRLLEYVRIESARKPVHKSDPLPCQFCGGDGTLRAADQNGYKALFKCPACENCAADYPTWSNAWERKGYSRILPDSEWDESDTRQIKGLALMGEDSIPWKKAPLPMQMRALALIKGGDLTRGGTAGAAMMSRSDPMKESERARQVAFVERVETDPEPFSPF